MAVLQAIRDFFSPAAMARAEELLPAQPTNYHIRPLTTKDLSDVIELNARCFTNGDNYTRHTFSFLLDDPQNLAYRVTTDEGKMAGFVLVMLTPDGAAHLTTIGIAPEHRRRGLAERLLLHLEGVLKPKGVSTIVLEVRASNLSAQKLYEKNGYYLVQRVTKYYDDGEDGYLMMRSII